MVILEGDTKTEKREEERDRANIVARGEEAGSGGDGGQAAVG